MPKNKGGLPDRWLEYNPLGQRVPGTRFIAFKVPLKEALCRGVYYNDWFTPRYLMDQVPQLGLVVDLTFTSRYYFPQDFERRGVEYKKVRCPGHVIPPKKLMHRFYDIVDEYIYRNPNSETLIGVHCTHGLNRTALFVCSYMIERMGIAPQEALEAFQNARGYKVERENYIQELLSLKPLSAPPLDELETFYPSQQQPDTRKRPAQYDYSYKEKVQKQDVNSMFQGPTHAQYGVATHDNPNHQRNHHAFRGEEWNASHERQPQRYSRFVSEQDQRYFDNTNASERKNNYSFGSQGKLLDNFGGGGQGALTNGTGDFSIRHMKQIDKYKIYGNSAWAFKSGDSLSARGGKSSSYSGDNGRGRILDGRDRGMPVNTINKFSSTCERSQLRSEGLESQNIRRHHPVLDSKTKGRQSRRHSQSSNLPS